MLQASDATHADVETQRASPRPIEAAPAGLAKEERPGFPRAPKHSQRVANARPVLMLLICTNRAFKAIDLGTKDSVVAHAAEESAFERGEQAPPQHRG